MIMKSQKLFSRTLMLAMIAMAVALSACKEKAVFKNFETEYSFKVTIPANSLLSSSLFPISFEQQSNSEGEYAIHDTRKDLVDEVTMKSFLIEVVSPHGEDLSFLNYARFFIDAEGEPEIMVASKDPVPSNAGSDILLEVGGQNLAPYIRKEPFEIRTEVGTDENRTHDITLQGRVKFDVRAKILDFS